MKKLLIFILLFNLTSCQEQNQKSSTATNNEEFVKQYFEYFNNHDFTKMSSLYTDTANFKDPSLGQGIIKQTRQQTIEKYTELVKIFPDLHDEIIRTYPSGKDHIIVEFVSTGTGPDQLKFELPICTIFTIENGLITNDFTYYDNFDVDQ